MSFLLRYRYPVIAAAVLLPRLAWFALLGGQLPVPARDQGIYIELAGRIVSGEGLSFSRELSLLRGRMAGEGEFRESWLRDPEYIFGAVPVETPTACIEPGYPLLLAAVFTVTGPRTGGVFLLNCIFALLGAWAMMKLAGENWGERQGMLAALIWSVYPFYVYYGAYAMTETIHISLLPLILLLTVRSLSRASMGATAGFVTGILFLVRSTVIFLLPLQGAWLLLRKRWKAALLLAAGFLICCIPWVLRNTIELGSPVLLPTKGSLNLWMRNNPDILALEGIEVPGFIAERINRIDLLEYPSMEGLHDEISRSRLIGERSVEFMLSNPILIGYLTVNRALHFLSPFGSKLRSAAVDLAGLLIYLPMLLIAAVEAARRRKDGAALLAALTFLLYMGVHAMAHGGARYRLPVDMVLILFTTLFIGRVAGWEAEEDGEGGE